MPLKPFQFTKAFIRERCDYCGRCFHECPPLHLPLEQAQKEIRTLIDGGDSEVLRRCTGCMACNSICPYDANPHTLIMNRWSERNRKEGLFGPAGLVLPYQEPNLYTVALRRLPEDESVLVRQWEQNWREPPACDTMIFAGCNMMLQPFLMDSALYADIPIFGSLQLCCGEPFYRMGCWDAAKAAALNVKREFDRMRLKKIIVPCLACHHLFTHVYPKVLDVPLDVEVTPIEDWLYGRIMNGEIKVAPLNVAAVVQDNCWPKASGDALFDKVRALLALLGVTAVEPENTRERALCCGMCAGAARFSLLDTLKAANKLLGALERTQADLVVDYCGGCNWLLGIANSMFLSRYKKPRYHILELVQMATGETPKRRTDQRARQVIRSMAAPLTRRYLRGGRFRIDSVAGIRVDGEK